MAMHSQQPTVDPGELIGELDRKLDRLKILYEQYFMGIEKREPLVPLKEVVRIIRELEQTQIRNTGLRYRYRTLVQKFNTYKTYWHRILRAIENGTYQRDVARMSRNLARKGFAMPQIGRVASPALVERAVNEAMRGTREPDNDTERGMPAIVDDDLDQRPTGQHRAVKIPLPPPHASRPLGLQPEPSLGPIPDDEEDEDTTPGHGVGPLPGSLARPVAGTPAPTRLEPPVPAGARTPTRLDPPLQAAASRATPRPELPGTGPVRPPRAEPAAADSMPIPEADLRSLYRRFVRAKEMCGEDVSKIRYESLVKSIAQQLPRIQAEHGREVEFQVVIREGRAVLRAKPR